VKLAADANVLLSAVIGGSAKRVFEHPLVEEVLSTEATIAEVQEYAAELAEKKGLPPDLVLLAAATLPVTLVERSAYEGSIDDAQRRIGQRDPDDVELLALALAHDLAVWSNDNDFADAGVKWFPTAALLAFLESHDKPAGA